MRYSPLDQIDRSNVGRLEQVWSFSTGELKLMQQEGVENWTAFECTPLFVNGILYLSTPSGRVLALDGDSGRKIWEFDPQSGASRRRFQAHRGVAYWEPPSGEAGEEQGRIFSGTSRGTLICLQADRGLPCPDFGEEGIVDLRKGVADAWPEASYAVTSPPAVFGNLVITGAQVPEDQPRGPAGDVRAFDARTGREVWRFHTVPRPGQEGHDSWEGDSWKERTGANVWSIMSVDPKHRLLFLPVGSPSSDFYGGDRKGKNLFGNSLVALDAETGELRWYYQLVHHDIWDYDLPAQPVLVELLRQGERIPAVVQVTKMGFVFVFHRLTGDPLFPIEERPMPSSPVPGESTWPTQPFPALLPPLSRQEAVGPEDLAGFTPEHGQECAELFRQAAVRGGVFEPAGLELTLSFPGTLGGATWSGASFDPALGYLFVNVNELGRIARMEPQESPRLPYRRNSPWGAYARFWDRRQWPCQRPPWGTLNALDLNTGRLVWKVPLGVVEELVEQGIEKTGTPNLGGSIATAGGLVFIAGSNDRRFRAFDSRTGEELWVRELEASGHATPMTYLGKSGRQFAVVAAGGGGYFSQNRPGDRLVAFALPENP